MMKCLSRSLGVVAALVLLGWVAVDRAAAEVTRYVAPTARGTGDGSSLANAADWRVAGFWNGVKSNLNSDAVTVRFADGQYNNGVLDVSALGNANHHLTLRGHTDTGAVFNGNVAELMIFRGLQNATISNFHFTGPIQDYGLRLRGSTSRPTRDVVIENSSWINMTEVYYGALGTAGNVHHVTIRNNEFRNVGSGTHAHMIYNAYDPHHLTVENNHFEDSKGEYVRFRDNADFGIVRGNTFRSTGATYNQVFVSMPLFNDVDPGDEIFATNYVITDNTFEYYDPFLWFLPKGTRTAVQFAHYGYSPADWDYLFTAAEGNILENGTDQQIYDLLLTKTGIDGDKVFLYDNQYIHVDDIALFHSRAQYGAVSKGWSGYADITGILNSGPLPIPEPASLTALLLGGCLMMRRRRGRG